MNSPLVLCRRCGASSFDPLCIRCEAGEVPNREAADYDRIEALKLKVLQARKDRDDWADRYFAAEQIIKELITRLECVEKTRDNVVRQRKTSNGLEPNVVRLENTLQLATEFEVGPFVRVRQNTDEGTHMEDHHEGPYNSLDEALEIAHKLEGLYWDPYLQVELEEDP